MSVKMSVYYAPPTDAEAFEKHYLGTHIPLVDAYDKLAHRSFHKVRRVIAGDVKFGYVFTATWENSDDMKSDLNSEQAALATKDAQNLGVDFDVVFFEQLA